MVTGTTESPGFGTLLRRYRVAAGLSQEALAERAGLSARAISDLERDDTRAPRRDTVTLLAAALQLGASERAALDATVRRRRGPLVPAPASSDTLSPSLPPVPSPLLGRERDIGAVTALLQREEGRLLTLTGSGGVGKTSLALHVAAEQQAAFPDGVRFVDLSALRDAHLVGATVARSLGVAEARGAPLEERLQAALRDKNLLLVLDNFEQVAAAAPLLARLRATCSRLRILVTSRMALRVRGEHVYPVPPLAVPRLADARSPDALAAYAAVALFVARARAAKPDFQLTPANAPAVAAICQRLDGLPLALELAAARVTLLPPLALLRRLEQCLDVLAGGGPDFPERHQTLRGTVAWSYKLLPAAEQALFRRLAVFTGGSTLDAVEAVCSAGGALGAGGDGGILSGVAALVDQSLLQVEEQEDGEPRLRMLQMVQQYALEQLTVSGDEASARRRHAGYYLALAEAAEPQLTRPEQAAWLRRLEREVDNLRVALLWTIEHSETELGLRLAAALWRFWEMRISLNEGRRWFEVLLAQARGAAGETVPPAVRATALTRAGWVAANQADFAQATAWLEEGLALQRARGDAAGTAAALHGLGIAARGQGDQHRAAELFEESLALRRELRDTWGVAVALENLGSTLTHFAPSAAVAAQARALYEESRALFAQAGDPGGVAKALLSLGRLALREGDAAGAGLLLEESLARYEAAHNRHGVAHVLYHLGRVAQAQGDMGHARELYAESRGLFEELGDPQALSAALTSLEDSEGTGGADAQLARTAGT